MNEAVNVNRRIAKAAEKARERARQRSDGLAVGVLLTLAGGFLESYSFITRSEVLANCQSGNLVLTAMFAVQGKWALALRWFAPVVAFVIGVLLTEFVRDRMKAHGRVHWRQAALLVEIALIFVTGFMPEGDLNVTATVLIALACAIQADAFKKLHGSPYATIMCTANLRSGLIHLYDWRGHGNDDAAIKARDYFMIILCFMAGAILGTWSVWLLGVRAAWVCCVLMLGAFIIMLDDRG